MPSGEGDAPDPTAASGTSAPTKTSRSAIRAWRVSAAFSPAAVCHSRGQFNISPHCTTLFVVPIDCVTLTRLSLQQERCAASARTSTTATQYLWDIRCTTAASNRRPIITSSAHFIAVVGLTWGKSPRKMAALPSANEYADFLTPLPSC